MNTLLIRLEGPMQSWGVQSLFPERDTLITPSKSGVVGLLCAALGRSRSASIDDLTALTMGVRVDREGIFSKDFQTTQRVAKATSKPDFSAEVRSDAVISNRYYLADACFLVGLEGDDRQLPLLVECDRALQSPKWPLFLGRKSFIPSQSVWLNAPSGLQFGLSKSLVDALQTYPWLSARLWRQWDEPLEKLRYVIESRDGSEVRHDQPISFDLKNRRYANRRVYTYYWPRPTQDIESFAIHPEES